MSQSVNNNGIVTSHQVEERENDGSQVGWDYMDRIANKVLSYGRHSPRRLTELLMLASPAKRLEVFGTGIEQLTGYLESTRGVMGELIIDACRDYLVQKYTSCAPRTFPKITKLVEGVPAALLETPRAKLYLAQEAENQRSNMQTISNFVEVVGGIILHEEELVNSPEWTLLFYEPFPMTDKMFRPSRFVARSAYNLRFFLLAFQLQLDAMMIQRLDREAQVEVRAMNAQMSSDASYSSDEEDGLREDAEDEEITDDENNNVQKVDANNIHGGFGGIMPPEPEIPEEDIVNDVTETSSEDGSTTMDEDETIQSESELSEISEISEFEDSGLSGESGYLDGSFSSEATVTEEVNDPAVDPGEVAANIIEARHWAEAAEAATKKDTVTEDADPNPEAGDRGQSEVVLISEADSQTAGPSGLGNGSETGEPQGTSILRLMDSLEAEQPREVVLGIMSSIVNAAAEDDFDRNVRYDQIAVANRVITEAVNNGEDVTFNQIYTALAEMENEE